MESEPKVQLVRAIGRWSLAALVVNVIIGSGIFGLPDDVARWLGPAAPLAYLISALGIGVVMACFAEVASQFTEAGGPYLYARRTFGSFTGVQMGWFAWLVRLTAAAAIANLFVVYLGEFWEPVTDPVPRATVLTLLIGFLSVVNIRGVKSGANLSNFFTAAKLVPLVLFIGAGLWLVGGRVSVGMTEAPRGDWMQALLALLFAYGGFEAAVMPMSEAQNPRRDTPFALFLGLAVVATVYTLVHLVVMGALDDPGASGRPVSAAARVLAGSAGANFIALGALVSMYGNLSGQFLSAPRLTYAFAEEKDFPAFFAAVHPRFRTPYVSILTHTVLVWLLAVYGSFIWNAILSAVARLFTYAVVCAALPVLRRRQPEAAAFRLPGGVAAAVVGIAFCGVLVTQMGGEHLKIVTVVAAAATANYACARSRTGRTGVTPDADRR